jgi:hypothetical protein
MARKKERTIVGTTGNRLNWFPFDYIMNGNEHDDEANGHHEMRANRPHIQHPRQFLPERTHQDLDIQIFYEVISLRRGK